MFNKSLNALPKTQTLEYLRLIQHTPMAIINNRFKTKISAISNY